MHQIFGEKLLPDGEIVIEGGGGKEVRIALEIELTRKSQDRIKWKFGRYKKEIQFDFVFFITNKEGIFKGYGKHLTHMVKKIQDGVAVIYDPNLS